MKTPCHERPLALLLTLFVVLATLVMAAPRAAAADDKTSGLRQNPFAAHNAYPWRLYRPKRFERAIASGLKHIELDLTYDSSRDAVIVTHDGTPRGGEPELEPFLEPLWQAWSAADGKGYTLIFDFKTASPELAGGLHEILKPHADLLSTMPKQAGSKFQSGKITVCLTGSGRCQQLYAEAVPADDRYLAFGDHGHSEWRADAAEYVPREPAGFYRFLTFHFRAFLDGPDVSGPDHISLERMRQVAGLASERAYRMRIYTINPARRTDGQLDDRFWRQAVEAEVHMISTDLYEDARDWWTEYVAASGG